jgi:hypothetical protein
LISNLQDGERELDQDSVEAAVGFVLRCNQLAEPAGGTSNVGYKTRGVNGPLRPIASISRDDARPLPRPNSGAPATSER